MCISLAGQDQAGSKLKPEAKPELANAPGCKPPGVMKTSVLRVTLVLVLPYIDDDVEGVVVGKEDANAAAVLHDSVVVEGQFVHRGPGSGLGAGGEHLTSGPGRPRSPRAPSLQARRGG